MHTGVVLAVEARHRVACLVVGRELFLFGGHDTALLLRAGHHFHGCFLDVLHRDGLAAAAGSQQGSLVDEVFQVSARKTSGALRDDFQGHIRGQRLILGVDFQDLLTALDIGQAHIDLTVKAAGTEQSLIQNISTVGSGHDDDAIVGLKAIHLHQQLVQGLLALVVAAAEAGTTLTAHRIDLINKDDAGHGLLGLVKQVAHTGSTDTDVHLHEIRAGDGVERHAGLTGTGAGQQGLTGTRRAHQQHAVGDAGTQRVEFIRALEEFDHLFELFFLLVFARHIGKGSGLFVFPLVLDLGFAHVHDTAAGTAAAHHGEEQETCAAQHPQIEQDLHPGDGLHEGGVIVLHGSRGVGRVIRINITLHVLNENVGIGQLVADRHGTVRVLLRGRGIRRRRRQHPGQQAAGGICRGGSCSLRQVEVALFQRQGNDAGVAVQGEFGDLIVLKVVHHRRVAHGRAAGHTRAAGEHRPDHQHRCQCQRKDQRVNTRSFWLQE